MAEQPISLAQHYHDRTKYDPESLRAKAQPLDWSRQPSPFKAYKIGMPFDLRSSLETKAEDLSQPSDRFWHRLSRFLYYSYGITGVIQTPDEPHYLRAAPSAGGLYPAEMYLISRGTPLLPPGLYNYQARQHLLMHFWESEVWTALQSACFWHPALEATQLALVVTAVFGRSAWRYQDRAYRRICLDTGHLLGNLSLSASIQDFRPHCVAGFCDRSMNELLYLDETQESAIAVLPLADLKSVNQHLPAYQTALKSDRQMNYSLRIPDGQLLEALQEGTQIPMHDRAVSWSVPDPKPDRVDQYNFPFCLKIDMKSSAICWQDPPRSNHLGANNLAGLEETLLRRRSTRGYNGADMTLNELKAVLDFTYHPEHYVDQDLDHDPDYCDLHRVQTFIAVTGVTGLESGCYYYAPQAEELRQIRFKNFRPELHFLCLGQDLGRDAAAVIFHTADLGAAIGEWGDRAYRYLHLDAGHLGQRLNLAAIRLGLGVSGIAGFFDDQVNEVLGIPEDEAVLYITTLGRPRR
jgi:SagB-type dehydrogenase family enzyme